MIKIKCVRFQDPINLLGKHVHLFTKDNRNFGFKIMGCGPEWIEGHDDERMEMAIRFDEIDFILGG